MKGSNMRRIFCAVAAIFLFSHPVRAAESFEMPQGALLCKDIGTAVEHAKIVRQPSSSGIAPFVEAHTANGDCVVVKEANTTATVVGVDQRGFARVDTGNGTPFWTDAENVWGYFDAPAKLKAWKKP